MYLFYFLTIINKRSHSAASNDPKPASFRSFYIDFSIDKLTDIAGAKVYWPLKGKDYPIVGHSQLNYSNPIWMEAYGDAKEKCAVRMAPMNSMMLYWDFETDRTTMLTGNQMQRLISKYVSYPKFLDKWFVKLHHINKKLSSFSGYACQK